MHSQREHAEFLVTGKHAHILVVKKKQPGLHSQHPDPGHPRTRHAMTETDVTLLSLFHPDGRVCVDTG